MLSNETNTNLLHAVATGFLDRVRNIVITTDELADDERERLRAIVYEDGLDPAVLARRLGDGLREMGASLDLSNECYRLAFYLSDASADLTENELYRYFLAHRSGRLLDKWVHYFPIYERHLAKLKDTAPTLLEIGVYRGGSLDMWRRYFGDSVKLIGIDIDPTAAELADPRSTVVLGDQADPEFLRTLVRDHGPFDIVIDDGGHTMEQQITSIEHLFPALNVGGVYVVEDCHTSYWDSFGGGRRRSGTFIEWTKERVDDLHRYHEPEPVEPVWTNQVDGIHCYDSVVVFEKQQRFPPFSEQVGASEFLFLDRPASALVGEMLATRDAALTQLGQLDSSLADELRVARGEVAQILPRTRELEEELNRVDTELLVTRNDLLEAWAQVQAMRKTLSWRITAPLRGVRRWGRSG
ncbi:MAG: class I SAM-dependent methyltransferase [Acidimicrobiales bacterium]